MIAGVYWLAKPSPPVLLTAPQPEANQANSAQGVDACDQTKLAAIRDAAERATAQKRCAEAADREHANESRLNEGRSAQAAEQAVWQAYYQARLAAFQSALAVLILVASAWAAWAATRAAGYAKEAARETKSAAKAAHNGNRLARITADRQLKGYLVPDDSRLTIAIDDKGRCGHTIVLRLKNCGGTPIRLRHIKHQTFTRVPQGGGGEAAGGDTNELIGPGMAHTIVSQSETWAAAEVRNPEIYALPFVVGAYAACIYTYEDDRGDQFTETAWFNSISIGWKPGTYELAMFRVNGKGMPKTTWEELEDAKRPKDDGAGPGI